MLIRERRDWFSDRYEYITIDFINKKCLLIYIIFSIVKLIIVNNFFILP